MKSPFTRWLPAIAKTPSRQATLSVVGVAVIGGLAFGPTAVAAPITSTPHAGAVAAIDLATGKSRAADPVESGLTTGAWQAGGARTETAKPTRDELIPHGVEGAQSRIPLDDAQVSNARAIIATAKQTGVGERGAVIGVATSLQESKLYNLGHLGMYNDHDSQGLFQQRPSSGWGTPDQITDPEYAATAFFEALKNVGGWQELPLTAAAQTVQVSAYPYAYAQWEQQAADIVHELW
ncbi:MULTISPECIES: hypothetical protein [Micromonospora]|uniref:Uncharacterized protein n=1 Tax=Micromonospora yangpuensis TaxID=683228 RepID=A0A1C6UT93_9ACTN|nr:hypothetical protein [Micromonospora yangpuensis]GGM24956.1 hypothetical protein GCM10012279_49260 [Micromonospora yangpuensis]SCL57246.1 hypothetical protein GA0070617_3473 [Micromonospora yangpuensis]